MNLTTAAAGAMLALLAGCASAPTATGNAGRPTDETRPLLDGSTLDGWSGDVVGWTLKDGVLTCGPNGQAIYAPGEWSDYELS
ncbi:MAG: hypothetical protein ACKOGJ_09735, partial [Phycisphaerales bacterium]